MGKFSYPLGAKFGQFVHIGSMLKSTVELSSQYSSTQLLGELDGREQPELAAALSALNPLVERSAANSER